MFKLAAFFDFQIQFLCYIFLKGENFWTIPNFVSYPLVHFSENYIYKQKAKAEQQNKEERREILSLIQWNYLNPTTRHYLE